MQIITITGNVGKDPEQRTTQQGDKVTSFSVAAKQGYGENASTNWFRCSLWGKRGGTVSQYVRKGSKVTVTGEFSTREYEGKTQLEIRVSDLDWEKAEARQASGGGGGYRSQAHDDLDGDNVPFLSCDPAHERRIREARA